MKLKCKFDDLYDGYGCEVTSAEIHEPCKVTEIQGEHKEGKRNRDVRSIIFKDVVVHFIPRGLGRFFPKVTRLQILKCGLNSICRDDLKQFKNLEELNLHCNELTSLPDDLFQDTPNLIDIRFQANKIEYMSSKLFDPIINNQLRVINFLFNTEIHASYHPGIYGSVASVPALMAMIDSQCFMPRSIEQRTLFYSSKIHHQNILNGFEDLFNSGKFSDFVINVNDSKQFHVHKNILSAQCEGFAELFEEDPGATNIKIEDFSAETVEKLLRFLYTGELENFVENSLEIFELAAKLKALDLKDLLEDFIVYYGYEFFYSDNFDTFKAFSLAHSFNAVKLKRAAFEKLQRIIPERNLPESLIDDFEKVKEIVETWKKLEELVNEGGKLSL